GTITRSGNTFTVSGSHTYSGDTINGQSEGTAVLTVTVSHDATTPQVVTDTVTITDPAVVPTGGFVVTASEGIDSGLQTVATFTDPGGAEELSDYSASIAWGDGTAATAGTISRSGNVCTVQGGHAYAEEGTYVVTVTLGHDSAPNATASSTASVADA